MGKGGGCVSSKNKTSNSSNKYANTAKNSANVTSPTKNLKIFIVFYSMYGHVECLAKRIKKGIETVDGVEGVLYRAPETLSEDVLVKMQAAPKDDSIPEISSPSDLADADGFLFGFPTRFGCMAAQMKALFDSTGLLWKEQKLVGKPAGFFVSTGSQGGGQETTAWAAITQLAHHGMLFVPIGYTFGAGMFEMDSILGGSPYGAGVFAGDGSREATEAELALAEYQGKYMAGIVTKLVHG
ncbi:putative NAD(P)H dehydrogenase (quinone) FQR1-like 2 [Capsicum annuum]|uniref:NAD(P)H dehydrogenase (quinone) n=2 Tax=Capsicum annuum TaxID=4072 RepID=A0A1U8F154_CAPAN|nr:probable NAD(P)H dehydrogenase (quinone) FQR1-like 2 [Capsicum annuum]KAF3636434.1 putative NAD(P)H dehydrogenase (quinone) FQR1-like 2 [Capsicum annuum]KAF3639156.1 putative NAD(P)H dehydrogenase (quinone) FQR1-like 2 [Capsicum annuum]PHT83218.1 putative NAD(P)H dehydrogenase (quinone) FQR1-like 2 [Capsicum annuum]